MFATVSLAAVACISACSSSGTPHSVAAASDHDRMMLIDQVKQLEGTWEMPGEKGEVASTVFHVTANGSAVREIMFPGTPHEMTNVYHMDGPSLVMTHYCASGNQPRMRADSAKPGEVALHFDSVTNLATPQATYMGEMTLVMKDKDHFTQKWTSIAEGKKSDPLAFEWTRKK